MYSPKIFRALLDMLMCNDQDTSGYMGILEAYAESQSRELGYLDWIDAYHKYKAE